MDVVRRTANYAENQTKFFINDINSKDNSTRVKAIKRYKEYISTYRPEMYDDDVDFLFTGVNQHHNVKTKGLLFGCGQQSTKHSGQLKRIAGELMAFLQWLITLECEGDIENIFFERFIRLPAREYTQMALEKHISLDNSSTFSGAGRRGGNTLIACEVLSTLLQFHITEAGDPDPLDVDKLLNNDMASKAQFMLWLKDSHDEEFSNVFSSENDDMFLQRMNAVVNRPVPVERQKAEIFADSWEEVSLHYVPLQADEAGYGSEEELDVNEFDHIIPDPLGLSTVDLRSVMVHTLASRQRNKRNTSASEKKKRMTTSAKDKMNIMKRILTKKDTKNEVKAADNVSGDIFRITEEDEGDDEKSDCDEKNGEDHSCVSVIPSQKNFSPAAFLSYVHGYVSLQNLHVGLKNLELRLDQQSSRREDLVRQNFGPFICCVDGLTWLKEFQGLSLPKHVEPKKPTKRGTRKMSYFQREKTIPEEEHDENSVTVKTLKKGGIPQAAVYLGKAKDEAQNTLAPILCRMKRSRQLKNADQILRRLASFMEYPHAMKQLLQKGEYESVLNIYHRVESLPATSNLRILKRITTKSSVIMEEMKQKLIASLMHTSPVLPVVVRHMKLLNELECEEECRSILRKCFDKQVQLFEDEVKSIVSHLNETLTAAYMKGQELNLNNKDIDKTMSTQDRRGSYVKGTAMADKGYHRRRGRAATLLTNAHRSFMESIGDDFNFDTDEDNGGNDSGEFGVSLANFASNTPDDFLGSEKGSDSASVSSMESGSTTAKENLNQLRVILGEDIDKSFVYDDPHIDYAEFFCNKVREKDVTKMVDAIDQWLPSLHKIIQLLRNYNAAHSMPSLSQQKRLSTFNSSLTRGSSKSASVAYGRNQAVSSETKRAADVMAISADFLRIVILGFKNSSSGQKGKAKDEGKFSMMDSIGDVFHHMFEGPLAEPHLSESVMEVADIFEVVESILSSGESAVGAGEESADEMNFFGSSSYRESVLQIKAVAYDGQNAVAVKAMEKLMSQAVMLTSSVNKGNALSKRKVRDIDDIIRVFESSTLKHLYALVSVVQSPDWVAKTVWEHIQKVLDRFISSLALLAASVESLSDKAYTEQSIAKQLSFEHTDSNSNDRAQSVVFNEAVSAARLELENLEASLLNTQHIQLAKNKSLDFVKACVRLRTHTVQKLWHETSSIFPLQVALAGHGSFTRQSNSNHDATPEKRGSGVEHRRPSAVGGAQGNVEDRISLSTGSIIVLEENAVDKYLEFILLNFRTNTHASYSVVVKNEMTSEIDHSRFNHRGLPTHVSRILLDLGHIQSNLSTILSGMMLSQKGKNIDTSYENYLFHMICLNILTVFSDLVDSLARNSFSLHSTGRKYRSRRLSNSSLVKDPKDPSLQRLESEESDQDLELRFYSKCKYPLSCGQALEELEFFKMAVAPVLLTQSDIPTCIWVHDEHNMNDHVGKKYFSRDQLLQEGLLFVEAFRNKSTVPK